MATLRRMQEERRWLVTGRLLDLQAAKAETVYSLPFGYHDITWRAEHGVIAEGDTMSPSLSILDTEGRVLVEWGEDIRRDDKIVWPLLDLGRRVDCGYWPTDNPGETFAEWAAREVGPD
jgi:hypothetical protein